MQWNFQIWIFIEMPAIMRAINPITPFGIPNRNIVGLIWVGFDSIKTDMIRVNSHPELAHFVQKIAA